MREGCVHPTIVIEIEYGDTPDGSGHGSGPQFARQKLSLAWVLQDRGAEVRHQNVHGAIVVVVGSRRTHRAGGGNVFDADLLGYLSEGSVPIVPEHLTPIRPITFASEEKIEVTVVIVINERNPKIPFVSHNLCLYAHFFECAVVLVME